MKDRTLSLLFVFAFIALCFCSLTSADNVTLIVPANDSIQYNPILFNTTLDFLPNVPINAALNIWTSTGTLITQENVTNLCFQETANISTACGGLATGSYRVGGDWTAGGSPTFDASYGTFDYSTAPSNEAYVYINYTKPAHSVNATWQVKATNFDPAVNISIPSNCFNADTNNLMLLVQSLDTGGVNANRVYGACYNSTGWQIVWDGGTGAGRSMYEEAIIWNMTIIPTWTKSLSLGDYKWNVYSCSASVCAWAPANYTFTVSGIQEVSQTYTSSVYETSLQTYILTTNYTIEPTYIYLIYNGTSHTATKVGTGSSNINYTVSFDVPVSTGTKSFYWTDGTLFNSTTKTQIVNPLIFNICNSTLNVSYLNITVKDEKTLALINSSVPSATISYWLGSGSVTKSFLYQNNSQGMSRAFCLSPGHPTLSASFTNYQYADTLYPQRVYSSGTLSLTNTTTNKVLYLLSSTDGIYTTFVVLDSKDGLAKVGATVTASVSISGTPTIIVQGTTDTAGSVTFWLDPTALHTIQVTKSGCSPQTLTVYPSVSGYTITMDCGGGAVYQSNPLEGVIWQKYPVSGTATPGNITFFYNVMTTAANVSIVKIRFELWNGRNDTMIMSNTTLVSSGLPNCNALQCNNTLYYEAKPGEFIKGKYYIDIGQGYVLVEADAMWKYITPSTTRGGIWQVFTDLKNIFNEMGTNSSLCVGYPTNTTCNAVADCVWKTDPSYTAGGICVLNDELNKQEYSRIVFFFFLMAICMALANKISGEYDNQNPGILLFIPLGIIFAGSLVGGATGQGIFYYNSLSGSNFINNYILAFTALMMAFGYYCAINRRYAL